MQPQPHYEQTNAEQPKPPTVGSSVHLYSSVPLPADKPKNRSTFALVVLGIILVPVVLDKVVGQFAERRPSGVSYQGRSLSQGEARAAVRDFANISKGLQVTPPVASPKSESTLSTHPSIQSKATRKDLAGAVKNAPISDPVSPSGANSVQTQLGQRFQKLIQTALADNAQYMRDTAEARSAEFLTPGQLGTPDGRALARNILTQYQSATTAYRKEEVKLTQQITEFSKELTGEVPANLAQHNVEQAEIEQLDDSQTATIENVLDLVDRAKPSYDAAGNRLVFENDADVAAYSQLADELKGKQEKLERRREEVLQGRQRSMQEANRRLQQYAGQVP